MGNDLTEYCDVQTLEVPKGQFSLSATGGVGESCWSIDETPIIEPLEMSAQEVQNEEYMRLEFKLYIRENLNIPDTDTCTHPSAVLQLTLIMRLLAAEGSPVNGLCLASILLESTPFMSVNCRTALGCVQVSVSGMFRFSLM